MKSELGIANFVYLISLHFLLVIMLKTEPKIDAYITKAQPFAKPILIHIRELVHKACPDVEEKIKWGFPHFDYKDEMMCSMAAFKNHAVFGFWKAPLMKDKKLFVMAQSETAMGHSVRRFRWPRAVTRFLSRSGT